MLRHKILFAFLALFVGLAAAQQKVMPSTYTAFTESPYPETSTDQQKNLASDYIIYKGSMQPLQYTELIRSGTTVGNKIFGQILDTSGNTIPHSSILGNVATISAQTDPSRATGYDADIGTEHGDTKVSNMQDFVSLLKTRNVDSPETVWAVVHLEDRPANIQILELEQAAATGILTVKALHKADFSADGGLIATCAGSVSPWNTHLGGEEWGVPDSIKWDASTTDAYTSTADLGRDVLSLRHLDLHDDDLTNIKAAWSPYMHRWVNEVAIDDSSSTTNPTITATKHYSMGRYSIELPYCIGDTPQVCYITDDSNTGVAAMFIPDEANDLSAGTLYAMKVTQTSTRSVGGGMFNVEWISLGHATNAEIKALMTKSDGTLIQFTDMFEIGTKTGGAYDFTCASGFTATVVSGGAMCLKLKSGMEKAASRFETRIYAAYVGASSQWRKLEGITYSKNRKEMYFAISSAEDSMEHQLAEDGDHADGDHIGVEKNKCGCVYRAPLDANNRIESISPLICGVYEHFNSEDKLLHTSSDDTCDIHNIANPDNVAFMEGHDILLIGEDTSKHKNNAVWAYHMESHALTRISTVVQDAETTGVWYVENINGWSYIMNQVQHPDEGSTYGGAGTVGYLGPIKVPGVEAEATQPVSITGASGTFFGESPFPETSATQQSNLASPWIVYKGLFQKLQYTEIIRSGDKIDGVTFAQLLDSSGQTMLHSSELGSVATISAQTDPSRAVGYDADIGAATKTKVSNMEDFVSILKTRNEATPNTLWAVVHLEDRPANIQVVRLKQNPSTGILVPDKIFNTDFSRDGGLIATCAGSVSPWNTHLGGEEWGVPDSIKWDASTTDAYTSTADLGRDVLSLRHLDLHDDDLTNIKAAWSPYMHRWVNEVAIDDSSSTTNPTITATKHYSMGRYSIELPYCIGDTPQVCYITDDSNTGVAAMFIPDEANDLSAGTLYAMKVTQTSTRSVGGGMFNVEWISLGHATNAEIKALMTKSDGTLIQFTDMFEIGTKTGGAYDFTCASGFTATVVSGGAMCLKLKSGMEKAASRFETRIYAAYVGASSQWRKLEGITYSKNRKEMYFAISSAEDSMEHQLAEDGDHADGDHIGVEKNKCGCVYRAPLDANNRIESISPLICGVYEHFNSEDKLLHTSSDDTCDIHNIANPDNVAFMEGHDILLIGEDTSKHKNNAVWAYHMESHALTRISTVVQDAETTGVWYVENINGWSYIMNQVQHPDEGSTYGGAGTVGYLGPIKVPGTAAVNIDSDGKKAIELAAEAREAAEAAELEVVSGSVSIKASVPAFAAVLAILALLV